MNPRSYPMGRLVRVIDADTYRMDLDLGFRCLHSPEIRLQGYSFAELDETGGLDMAHLAERLILGSEDVAVITYKTRGGGDRRSFARWVADVLIGGRWSEGDYVDGTHLGAAMNDQLRESLGR